MPTGRRRLASSLSTAEPSSPNEAKALSNNPADNTGHCPTHPPTHPAGQPQARVDQRLLSASRPRRTTRVETSRSPALATRFGSSNATSIRSRPRDTCLTESASRAVGI